MVSESTSLKAFMDMCIRAGIAAEKKYETTGNLIKKKIFKLFKKEIFQHKVQEFAELFNFVFAFCAFYTLLPLTGSAVWQLRLDFVVLLLQRFDVTVLAQEEVGDCCLTHDQNAAQKSESCNFVGPGGAGPGNTREKTEKLGRFFIYYGCNDSSLNRFLLQRSSAALFSSRYLSPSHNFLHFRIKMYSKWIVTPPWFMTVRLN